MIQDLEKAYALHNKVAQSGTELQCKLKKNPNPPVQRDLICQVNSMITDHEETANI